MNRHALAAAAAGALLPPPLFDGAAVAAIQVSMLRRLARQYGVPFSRDLGKSLVAALTASLPTVKFSILKIVPVLGTLTGAATVSGISAASTYAVGRVFIQHFESGGTLLTFDPARMREHFEEALRSSPPTREGY